MGGGGEGVGYGAAEARSCCHFLVWGVWMGELDWNGLVGGVICQEKENRGRGMKEWEKELSVQGCFNWEGFLTSLIIGGGFLSITNDAAEKCPLVAMHCAG